MIFKRNKKNILIIGYGQIGKAIFKLYNPKKYNVYIKDIKTDNLLINNIHIMDICIPYSNDFVDIVKNYIDYYKPKLTIIHSTVLPGTTKKIKRFDISYSPVIGTHPDLFNSIKTFTKFIGANDKSSLKFTKKHFKDLKIKFKVLKNSKTVETAKILSTLYYGMCISFHNDVDLLCSKNNLSFEQVMTEWNKEYNRGYNLMNKSNVIRPVLKSPKGKIGGHCIIKNAEIIKDYFDSKIVDYVLKLK
tara:strand:- start:1883 stop:2620 length:738 start_codon:yes stop_codon:yes gene_type:complete